MIELLRREFVVDVPLDEAWERLARIEAWPSWAHHIKRVTLQPPGALSPTSRGVFRLRGGLRSTFRMEEYERPRRWQWVGRMLMADVHYDHQFASVDGNHTRLTWIVLAEGVGARTLGPLFGSIYSRNLDRAIPNLQAEMSEGRG